jgi:hypothetical protein
VEHFPVAIFLVGLLGGLLVMGWPERPIDLFQWRVYIMNQRYSGIGTRRWDDSSVVLGQLDERWLDPDFEASVVGRSSDHWIETEIKRLPLGHMAVNVADRMRAHRRERLTVAIGKAEKEQVIAAVGEAHGEILTDEVKVGSLMRVEVTGEAFDIERPERVDKVVVEGEATVWDYCVTPKRPGIHALTIRGIVRIRLASGEQEYYELPVVERAVQVRVNAAHTLRQLAGLIFSKLFAALVFAWGLAFWVIDYVLKLDAVKAWISSALKPFLPSGH